MQKSKLLIILFILIEFVLIGTSYLFVKKVYEVNANNIVAALRNDILRNDYLRVSQYLEQYQNNSQFEEISVYVDKKIIDHTSSSRLFIPLYIKVPISLRENDTNTINGTYILFKIDFFNFFILATVFTIILVILINYIIKKQVKIKEEFLLLKHQREQEEKQLIMAKQVAHDIRSPLATLNTVCRGLKDQDEFSQMIGHSIKRINKIANDLLTQSKVNVDQTIKDENAKIKTVDEIIREKNIIQNEKDGVLIELLVSENFQRETEFIIPESELARVLSNILNNSIEAVEKNNGKISVDVTMNNDQVVIVISDNGNGIPHEILDKIGEMEFSYGKEANRESGTGLGLYHAKQTIAKYYGELTIASVLNRGTDISIQLPIRSQLQSDIKPEKKCAEMILFEDDELVKMTWTFQAKKLGIILHCFANYNAFFLEHQKRPFSLDILIYSDVNLSSMENGVDLLCKLDKLGFRDLNLCTGYDKNSINVPSFVKNITDKSFPKNL